MKSIMGIIKPVEGDITFMGKRLNGSLGYIKLYGKWISLVPEGRSILQNMSVLENLEMGAYQRKDKEVQADIEKIYALSYFGRKKKSIWRYLIRWATADVGYWPQGLMARPQLLLLDEPSMGLALLVQDIFNVIKDINREGTTVLLVEQNAKRPWLFLIMPM